MRLSKINSLDSVLIALFLLAALVTNASAETTFFDNPDDAFIMGSPAAGGVTAGTAGVTMSGGGCAYRWNCTNWSECLPSGKQARNCTNTGTCSSTYESPEIERNCTYIASPVVEREDERLENRTGGENGKEPGNETKSQNETWKIAGKEIVDDDEVLFYFIIALMICFIILYLKKNYFKAKKRKPWFSFFRWPVKRGYSLRAAARSCLRRRRQRAASRSRGR